MSVIYLDNAATTQVSPGVLEEMLPYLKDDYGNPSSNHSLGIRARKAKEAAREKVASLINASPEEIFFTSGATEANNWVLSAVNKEFSDVGCLMASNIEHASILKTAQHLTNDKFMALPVSGSGEVSYKALERRFQYNTTRVILLSVMMANNETGVVNDLREITNVAHRMYVPVHTDATQALGHIKVDVKDVRVDALSGSAHKIHGPKGVGFLYINKNAPIYDVIKRRKMFWGGHQEENSRAGTENIPGIVGLGAACEETRIFLENKGNEASLMRMSNDLIESVRSGTGAILNCDNAANRIPVISMRIPGVNNHELCQLLDEDGVCVSAGSACNENNPQQSHVLTAMGLKPSEIDETIRISIGRYNSDNDIKVASEIIIDKINTLRMFSD